MSIRRYVKILLLALSASCIWPNSADAGEKPEHYDLIVALARASGLSAADAHVIASASWSVDLNDATVAYRALRGEVWRAPESLVANLMKDPLGVDEKLARNALFSPDGPLRHAALGLIYHALGTRRDRDELTTQFWQPLLHRAKAMPSGERLILVGIYLHFVVDRYVHPDNAIVGHLFLGHWPDRAINQPEKFAHAGTEVFGVLKTLADERNPDAPLIRKQLGVTSDADVLRFSRLVTSAISKAYAEAGYTESHSILQIKAADLRDSIRDDEIARNIKRTAGPRFRSVIPDFDIPKFTQLDYTLDKGELVVKSAVSAEFRIEDPVRRLEREPALDQPRQHLIKASQNAILDIDLAAVISNGMKQALADRVAVADAETLVTEARSKFRSARIGAGTIYERDNTGDLRIYQRSDNGAIKAWKRIATQIQLVEAGPGTPPHAYKADLSTVTPLRQTEPQPIGGVRLSYVLDILQGLEQRSSSGGARVTTIPGPFRLLSLKRLASEMDRQGPRTNLNQPLPLSRIYGYVVVGNDDVVLIGASERGKPAIIFADLVTALRYVWQSGETPAVSLDPIPSDFQGPHYARVMGIPRNTHFARVMLDADYQMKKITLGTLPVQAGAFKSWPQLAREGNEWHGGTATGRFWLSPIQPTASDIQVSGAGDQALFASRIQVLSETLEFSGSGLRGTGVVDRVQDEAAQLFSQNYQSISQDYPDFYALQGLNDLVLLCRLLRKTGVKAAPLSQLADAGPLESTSVPVSYPGVTKTLQWMADGDRAVMRISGGAYLRIIAAANNWLRDGDPQLSRMHAAAQQLHASGDLVSEFDAESIVVAVTGVGQNDIGQALLRGGRYLEAQRYEDAVHEFSWIVTSNDGVTEAYLGRAIAWMRLGDSRRALEDLEIARRFDPTDEQLVGVETFVAIDSGLDLSEVFGGHEVSSSAKRQAGQEFVRAGLAHQSAGRLERAEKDFSAALLLLGPKADVLTLRACVRVQRAAALSGKPEFDEVSYSALKDLENVLHAVPDNEVALLARSKWRILNFQFEDAESDASFVLRREPANALAYGYRAMARIGRGCASLALTDLSEAIGIAPEDAALRLMRAKLYLGIGELEKAKADFLQVALTDPIVASDVLNTSPGGFHVASSAHSCTP